MEFGFAPFHKFDEALSEDVFKNGDFSKFNFLKIVKESLDVGFKCIEMPLDIICVIPPKNITHKWIKELKRLKDKSGFAFSAHLPIWSLELASPNAFVREASIKCIIEAINLAERLKPLTYVMHSTGALAAEFVGTTTIRPPIKTLIVQYFAKIAERSIKEILSAINVDSERIAVETVVFPFELSAETAKKLGLSICLDTGHILAGYPGSTDVLSYLDKYKDSISEIHLHDGYIIRKNGHLIPRDHLPLGAGKLPIAKFFRKLEDIGFNGPIVFELGIEDAKKSLEAIEKVYPKAFRLSDC